MELSRPFRIVTGALDGELLTVLAAAQAAFTGRELARMVRASPEGARLALTRLVEQGIVDREPAGNAQLYRLNREHVGAPAILALAGLREALFQRVRGVLAGWDPAPLYAALFGSAARGDERADSDFDLFVLRPLRTSDDDAGWRQQVAALERDVTRWTGNDTRVLDIGADDSATVGGVVDDILRDGIPLAGDVAALRRLRRSIGSQS
jgi:DNA-binding transcriptional ArsR family regulator